MTLHKDLAGADLHEPKGIASATSGQIYRADGAGSGTWSSLVIPSGLFNITVALFTSSGTWTKPANMFMAEVTCIGGGGGGGNGGNTSFGTYCAASGGTSSGGSAGTGTIGDLLLPGLVGQITDTDRADAGLTLGVYGRGGTGSTGTSTAGGSGGGAAIKFLYSTTGTVTVTVGAAGAAAGLGAGGPGLVIVKQYVPI